MDLKQLNETIDTLISKCEDKEQIGMLGSLKDSIKEQADTFQKQEDEYLTTIAKWRDAYKESILKGGFQSKETSQMAEPVQQAEPVTFENILAKFSE